MIFFILSLNIITHASDVVLYYHLNKDNVVG